MLGQRRWRSIGACPGLGVAQLGTGLACIVILAGALYGMTKSGHHIAMLGHGRAVESGTKQPTRGANLVPPRLPRRSKRGEASTADRHAVSRNGRGKVNDESGDLRQETIEPPEGAQIETKLPKIWSMHDID